MKSERIGLRFSKKDDDIISWFLMLRENNIEQSFAVKALLKAFFLNEHVSGGTVKIRHNISMEPTSIDINENLLNKDIMNIKSQGIKLASFTKDIIRLFIRIGNEDKCPEYYELQNIHTKYKIRHLNSILCDDVMEAAIASDNGHIEKINKETHINTFNNSKGIGADKEIISSYNERKMDSQEVQEINDNSRADLLVSENNNEQNLSDVSNKNTSEKPKTKIKKRNPLLAQI